MDRCYGRDGGLDCVAFSTFLRISVWTSMQVADKKMDSCMNNTKVLDYYNGYC
jgi:hypothetical protein